MNALRTLCLSLAVLAAAAQPAFAFESGYAQRTKVTLNTSPAGVETKEALSGVAVPVRLHSGNFDFTQVKPDGSDLKVLAGDDKTPLKFSVERFNDLDQMAVLWVQLPSVAPGTDKNTLYVYAGNEKAPAHQNEQAFDSATAAAFHFAEKDGSAADHTGALKAQAPVAVDANGQIGQAAKLTGAPVVWAANDKLKAAGGNPYSISLWAKPAAAGGTLFAQGPLSIVLEGGKVVARLGTLQVAGGDLPVSTWAQVGLVLGTGKATLYVNGAQAAQADLPSPAPAVEGEVKVGEGYSGSIDELQIATSVRSAEWMKFARAAQGADAKLVASVTQTADSAEEGSSEAGYIGILVKNLTIDAIIVIAILGVMFVISMWVMVTKAVFVGRADKDNRGFLKSFREARDVLVAEGPKAHPDSPLARLYEAGLRELNKRDVGKRPEPLSGASLDAVKASIDADLVRENHELNSKMVLLTIAISGGPFLGLLGTVVGVMITFAAIAAAGDVNVNAIAPGIAAALLATVAGLGVAIPALFGYNYLAARIKNISSDMQIFVDEFVTRVAESYGAR
ncbi:MAG: DUF2341 domain-containing protein [Aquabacterium sp.]|nr:MAG: DUF2341 domain-containing protein [Aquabacterium sp.]